METYVTSSSNKTQQYYSKTQEHKLTVISKYSTQKYCMENASPLQFFNLLAV